MLARLSQELLPAGYGDAPSLRGHPVSASGYSSYQGTPGTQSEALRGVDTQQGSLLDSVRGHPVAGMTQSPSGSADSRYQGTAQTLIAQKGQAVI